MVLMMVTTLQSEQRQQNKANISSVSPWSIMLDMEGEPIYYNFTEEVFQAMFSRNNQFYGTPGGGGGTLLYRLYRYVQPQRVWFFSRFGHK